MATNGIYDVIASIRCQTIVDRVSPILLETQLIPRYSHIVVLNLTM